MVDQKSHLQVIGLDRGNPGFLGHTNGSLGNYCVLTCSSFPYSNSLWNWIFRDTSCLAKIAALATARSWIRHTIDGVRHWAKPSKGCIPRHPSHPPIIPNVKIGVFVQSLKSRTSGDVNGASNTDPQKVFGCLGFIKPCFLLSRSTFTKLLMWWVLFCVGLHYDEPNCCSDLLSFLGWIQHLRIF